MPDAGSSRKRQILGYRFAAIHGNSGLLIEAPNGIPEADATYLLCARHKYVADGAAWASGIFSIAICAAVFGMQPRRSRNSRDKI
jgi:hypothetical protein